MSALRDWTRGGTLCLSKAVLDSLRPEDGRGDLLYRDYFRPYTLLEPDANLSSLERYGPVWEDDVYRHFYAAGRPRTEPRWFSFASAADLNRASRLAGFELVVYFLAAAGGDAETRLVSFPRGEPALRALEGLPLGILHDHRWLGDGRRPTRRLLLLPRTARLLSFPDEAEADEFLVRHHVLGSPDFCRPGDEAPARAAVGPDLGGCADYGEALRLCLDLPPRPTPPELAGDVADLSGLRLADEGGLFRVLGETPCLVVYCVGARVSGRGRRLRAVYDYATLAVASREGGRPVSAVLSEDVAVLCVYGERFCCRLGPAESRRVVALHLNTVGRGERLSNRPDAPVPKRAPGGAGSRPPLKGKKLPRVCRCRLCGAGARAYEGNMAPSGPERLVSVPLTATDLLRSLGLATPENLAVLETLRSLSLAAMDIESSTVTVDLAGPRPGPRVWYAEYDAAVLEGHVKKVQRPVMVAHTDQLAFSRGEPPWSLTVADDSVSAVFDMMQEYWRRVTEARDAAVAEKLRAAAPLLEELGRYRRAYCDLSWEFEARHREGLAREAADEIASLGARGAPPELEAAVRARRDERTARLPPPGKVHQGWDATLPGQLEKLLRRLCAAYTVFTFCG